MKTKHGWIPSKDSKKAEQLTYSLAFDSGLGYDIPKESDTFCFTPTQLTTKCNERMIRRVIKQV